MSKRRLLLCGRASRRRPEAKGKAEFDALSAKNKSEGDAFLAKNRKAAGVKATASGLQYQVLSQGTGARPGPNDTVKVNYTGTFVNGQTFDSSANNNPPGPTAIPLARVIPGFPRRSAADAGLAVITSSSFRRAWPTVLSRSVNSRRTKR